MAQQAPIEAGTVLFELAQTQDLVKVPERLICKNCTRFLLNAYKTACCEGSLCETCNTTSTGGACPFCKHDPLISNPSKALRGTAKNYLKSIEKAEQHKAAEMAKAVSNSQDNVAISETSASVEIEVPMVELPAGQLISGPQSAIGNEPAIDTNTPVEDSSKLRQDTADSAISGNDVDADADDDDEIEINVGPDYDLSEMPEPRHGDGDDEWYQDDQYYQEKPRRDSIRPTKQDRNNSFAADNADSNNNTMPSEAMFPNGMNMSMMNSMWSQFQYLQELSSDPSAAVNNPQDFMQMQNQWMATMQMNPMMAANMMQNYPNMQSMFAAMQQNMGMQIPQMPMGMNGNQPWNGNMMPFGGQGFNPMMNNGASFNQGQQYQSFQNGNFRDNTRFRGGRGRNNKRGRGGFYQQHDQFTNFNNMPFQNQNNFASGSNSINASRLQRDFLQQDQHSNTDQHGTEQNVDDDEFAPGGQDEVQEALGDLYKNKNSITPEAGNAEELPLNDAKQEEYQEDRRIETPTVVDSPQHEPEETYIPEAYREDLDFGVAPPTAPSGPAAKDVPYRARGHGRYASRGGRGSFHASNGYPPQSPARPVSQPQNVSPNANSGSGVIGAPTGPRAMRDKDVAPVRTLSRAESDVGFKIRGTANQAKDRNRDEAQQSITSRSIHDDYDDRSTSRRYSKYDQKNGNSQHHHDQDYDQDYDRKRRKSRKDDTHDNDHDMQDSPDTYVRSDSQEREASRREARRYKDKRDKHISKYKSSRRHEDESQDYENGDDYADDQSRSSRHKKSSGRHEEDERRDRDHDRAEKDKHRKRSRHDRDREDRDNGWEDEDEAESRRRSRKHKKEVPSSRKDRDGDRNKENDTDLGMRISGKANQSSEAAIPAQSDKDPHTLEREARNRERQEKEEQRRKNAAKSDSGLSGGRTRNVIYEDQIDSRGARGYNKSSRRR